MEVLHTALEILGSSLQITGLVTVMMMMIEAVNIESRGKFFFFSALRTTSVHSPVIVAIMKSNPMIISDFCGNIASITNASSPDEAMSVATRAPGLSIPWV